IRQFRLRVPVGRGAARTWGLRRQGHDVALASPGESLTAAVIALICRAHDEDRSYSHPSPPPRPGGLGVRSDVIFAAAGGAPSLALLLKNSAARCLRRS